MKNIKTINIIKILIITIMSIAMLTTSSNAKPVQQDPVQAQSSSTTGTMGGININTGKLGDIYGGQDSTYDKIAGKILGIVSYICYAAAFIILVYKGVQFMNKAPEAKAEVKKELVSAAIGAFILFSAGILVQTIGNIAMGKLF